MNTSKRTAVGETEDDVLFMKKRFYEELAKQRSGAAKNSAFLTDDRYQELIDEVQNAKVAVAKKLPRHYWLLKRYDVMVINSRSRLIRPFKEGGTNTIQFYVSDGELFDILHKAHVSIGHGGRDRLVKELSTKYKNITRHDVEQFLQICTHCQNRQKGRRCKEGGSELENNGRAHVSPTDLNSSRSQIDFIDFQSQPDGDYKFILVAQDYLTKFIVLKPLVSKQVEELTSNLVDIFALMGAPAVLQSGSGREVTNQVHSALKHYWPQLQVIYGRFRHNQSLDIKNMVKSWMEDRKSGEWSLGVRFVQLIKNQIYHPGVKMSPYEALFGCRGKIGSNTLNVTPSLWRSSKELRIMSEEDRTTTDDDEEYTTSVTETTASTSVTSQSLLRTTTVGQSLLKTSSTTHEQMSGQTSKDFLCCVCSKPMNGVQPCMNCGNYNLPCSHNMQ